MIFEETQSIVFINKLFVDKICIGYKLFVKTKKTKYLKK